MKYIKLWIALSVAAAGLLFLVALVTGEGNAAPTSSQPVRVDPCPSTIQGAQYLSDELRRREAGSGDPALYRERWLMYHNMIVGSPDCFGAAAVAASQAQLQTYLTNP